MIYSTVIGIRNRLIFLVLRTCRVFIEGVRWQTQILRRRVQIGNMPPRADLTGKRFGKLVAVEPAGKDKAGNVFWRCKCDCGGEIVVRALSLNKTTSSCGCKRRKNLIGKKYGKLLVVGEAPGRDGAGCILYRCLCDCGNSAIVPSRCLTSGNTKSCGCGQMINITGQRYGRLVAIKQLETNSYGAYEWLFKCDCGNEAVLMPRDAISGNT